MRAYNSTTTLKETESSEQHLSSIQAARQLKPLSRILLFVRAGGRCEFDGCNCYLLEHHLTLTDGNFAEVAHVVAFRPDGPRGREGTRPEDINDVNNLMLLCPRCHKLIDDHPHRYTRKTLEEYKVRHERRIHHVTDLGAERSTSVVVFKAPIGGETVAIPFDQVVEATSPRYPRSRDGVVIDLTQIADEGRAFTEAATQTIKQRVRRLFEPGGEIEKSQHISLFALGPIPLLVFLGRQLSNKVPSDLYHRHRDTEDWTWKTTGKPVRYVFRKLRYRQTGTTVALVLSLSGGIRLTDLPSAIRRGSSVYELTLDGPTPKPTYLRLRQDLENFRSVYQEALGTIVRHHGLLKTIDLFPAVPAPVAVLCGRELLPKVHPGLRVFDYDKRKGGFTFQLEVT